MHATRLDKCRQNLECNSKSPEDTAFTQTNVETAIFIFIMPDQGAVVSWIEF